MLKNGDRNVESSYLFVVKGIVDREKVEEETIIWFGDTADSQDSKYQLSNRTAALEYTLVPCSRVFQL